MSCERRSKTGLHTKHHTTAAFKGTVFFFFSLVFAWTSATYDLVAAQNVLNFVAGVPMDPTSVSETAPETIHSLPSISESALLSDTTYVWVLASTLDSLFAHVLTEKFEPVAPDIRIAYMNVDNTRRYRVVAGNYETSREAIRGKRTLGPGMPDDAWLLRLTDHVKLIVPETVPASSQPVADITPDDESDTETTATAPVAKDPEPEEATILPTPPSPSDEENAETPGERVVADSVARHTTPIADSSLVDTPLDYADRDPQPTDTLSHIVIDSSNVVAETPHIIADSSDAVADITNLVAPRTDVIAEIPYMVADSSDAVADSTNLVAPRTDVVAETPHMDADSSNVVADLTNLVGEAPNAVTDSSETSTDVSDVVTDSSDVVGDTLNAAADTVDVSDVVTDSSDVVGDALNAADDAVTVADSAEATANIPDRLLPEDSLSRSESTDALDPTHVSSQETSQRSIAYYTWVIASFDKASQALELTQRYQRMGFDVIMMAIQESDRTSTQFRVTVGQYESMDEAERMKKRDVPSDAPPSTWLFGVEQTP